jgi:hypothetical protein
VKHFRYALGKMGHQYPKHVHEMFREEVDTSHQTHITWSRHRARWQGTRGSFCAKLDSHDRTKRSNYFRTTGQDDARKRRECRKKNGRPGNGKDYRIHLLPFLHMNQQTMLNSDKNGYLQSSISERPIHPSNHRPLRSRKSGFVCLCES